MFAGLNSVTEELPISNLLFWFQSVRGQQEIVLYSVRFKKHMNLMMKTLIKKSVLKGRYNIINVGQKCVCSDSH